MEVLRNLGNGEGSFGLPRQGLGTILWVFATYLCSGML